MKETEIRFKIENPESILKLSDNWIEKHQKDTYFTGNFTGVFRIREAEKTEICHKWFNDDGTWNENEAEITEGDIYNLFKELGFKEKFVIDKTRKTAKVGNIEINIDNIKDLGLFCEMEIMEGEQEDLILFAEKVGINRKNIIKQGYVQLMEEKICNNL